MQERGYRTTTETAQGAVGVLSGDAAGAPAGFSMRGFSFGEVNILYNGISIGPQSITSRWMDTANLAQVEFLKGPSSLMSGLDAIGGSVNYVSRQPTSGPIRSELDLSLDSLGSVRFALWFRRQHGGAGPRLSLRCDRFQNEQLHRRRLSQFVRPVDATELSHVGFVQDVRGRRIQEGLRPRLLGHASGSHIVCRIPRCQRRGFGHGGQHVRRLDPWSAHGGRPHVEDQLQCGRQCDRRERAVAAQRISSGRSATTSRSRTKSITTRPDETGSTARPMPSTSTPRRSIAIASPCRMIST